MIGLVAVTSAGRAAAGRLAAAWPGETRAYPGPAAEALPRAWAECSAVVCFLATGATVRLIAPLLSSKHTDPAVVSVDEACRFAVALAGGHGHGTSGDGADRGGANGGITDRGGADGGGANGGITDRGGADGGGANGGITDRGGADGIADGGGANGLAGRVAAVLGAEAVITTATDAAGLPGLDVLGWPAEGAIAVVSRAMLDGELVVLEQDQTWPLPAFPPNVRPAAGPQGQAEGGVVGEATAANGVDGAGVDGAGVDGAGVDGAGVDGAGVDGAGGDGAGGDGAGIDNAGADRAGAGIGRAEAPGGGYRILVTDRVIPADGRTVLLRPPSLAVGVGASRGVSAEEVLGLVDAALATAGLSRLSVTALATVDAKAAEPGIQQAAERRGWPLITYPAPQLAVLDVPHPSAAALAAVGTPSVAEAAALASGDELVVSKQKSAMATAAVARIRPRGRLALVGLGPGARDLLPPRAVAELRRASVVVGLDQYTDQIRDLLRPGTRLLASGLGAEEARASDAVGEARQGHAVALVGSGDAGIYSMASPALSLAGDDIEVAVVPGITASLAAAALLGAPLGHDHVAISLSDLHTPWPVIERRVRAAADGDFVVAFYNPRSRGRDWQLRAALDLLAAHRPGGTPAGIVRNATRPGQQVTLTTLAELDTGAVDMLSIVVVGCRASQVVAGRLVTPRGYTWQPQ